MIFFSANQIAHSKQSSLILDYDILYSRYIQRKGKGHHDIGSLTCNL